MTTIQLKPQDPYWVEFAAYQSFDSVDEMNICCEEELQWRETGVFCVYSRCLERDDPSIQAREGKEGYGRRDRCIFLRRSLRLFSRQLDPKQRDKKHTLL